jgi:hypothetical protein
MTRPTRFALLAAVCSLLLGPALATAADPITPFNGKDTTGWKFKDGPEKSKWVVGYASLADDNPKALKVSSTGDGPPQLINQSTSTNIQTEVEHGDATISLEVMVPQGSNSGVYVLGEYEVQILDSYGKETVGPGDIGGLYGAAAPRVNAAKKPGEWQTLEIVFEAPKFEGDKKVANARFVKVTLNGEVIHENVEMKGPTPSGVTGKESPTGPLMFQGDHGPVAYRNIKITPKK